MGDDGQDLALAPASANPLKVTYSARSAFGIVKTNGTCKMISRIRQKALGCVVCPCPRWSSCSLSSNKQQLELWAEGDVFNLVVKPVMEAYFSHAPSSWKHFKNCRDTFFSQKRVGCSYPVECVYDSIFAFLTWTFGLIWLKDVEMSISNDFHGTDNLVKERRDDEGLTWKRGRCMYLSSIKNDLGKWVFDVSHKIKLGGCAWSESPALRDKAVRSHTSVVQIFFVLCLFLRERRLWATTLRQALSSRDRLCHCGLGHYWNFMKPGMSQQCPTDLFPAIKCGSLKGIAPFLWMFWHC